MQSRRVEVKSTGGVSFFTLLGLLFIGLKLGKVITWPWWQVLLPIWGPFVLVSVILIVVVLFVAIFGRD